MTRNVDETGYAVGRGKPPMHTRFQPGRSGNPRGRPKGCKNFHTIMDEALGERVAVLEHGSRRRLTKAELASRQLVNKAAGGDLKGIALLLKYLDTRPAAPSEQSVTPVFGGEDDDKLLTDMLDHLGISDKTSGKDK